MIDYSDPDAIIRQNTAPNATCDIDGQFYDIRNLLHVVQILAAELDALRASEAAMQAAVAKAVEAEREACAKIAMQHEDHSDTDWSQGWHCCASSLSATIRARKALTADKEPKT